jgi:hypothetical protein
LIYIGPSPLIGCGKEVGPHINTCVYPRLGLGQASPYRAKDLSGHEVSVW